MRRQQHQNNKRRGAALVELALVLPIFFAVVLGIIEFGRAMMVGQMVANAAREASRLAILDGSTNGQVQSWIEEFMQESINVGASDLNIQITVEPGEGNEDPNDNLANAQPRDLCKIRIEVPFNKVAYIKGDYLDGKYLKGHSAMRHE